MGYSLAIGVILLCLSCSATPDDDVEATRIFSINLLKIVLKNQASNVVLSPLSVATLLAILQQGASGNTSLQLQNILQLSPDASRNIYGHMVQSLKKQKSKSILEYGSSVFLNSDLDIAPKFKETVQRTFLADIIPVNFKLATEATRKINSWVSSITKNRIKEIVTADDLTATTEMILSNAVYFKGTWLKEFALNRTHIAPFYPQHGVQINVNMMHQLSHFRAGEDNVLGVKWLELPFDGEEFSMVLILPTNKYGLDDFIANMTPAELLKIFRTHTTRQCLISLPRFKIDVKGSLVSTLQTLGLADLFNAYSDLSGISKKKGPLEVHDIIHRAEIEVNEQGSIAAATTAIIVNTLSLSSYEDEFRFIADHPFLFTITDKVNKIPLFMGRVNVPRG